VATEKKFADELFIADPLAAAVTAAAAAGHDEGVAEGWAAKRLYAEYMNRWDNVKTAAGCGARHPFEGAGTHGLRRGAIQEALENGASLVEVSQRAGHSSLEMTGVYIDQVVEDTTELFSGLDPQPPHKMTANPTDHNEILVSCEIEHLGAACGRDRTDHRVYRVVIDGAVITICSIHYQRHLKGMTGNDLARPLRSRASDRAAACEIDHHGVHCGRNREDGRLHGVIIDGVMITACSTHYQRLYTGKTGEDLTRPLRLRPSDRAAACEIEHRGVPCGRNRDHGLLRGVVIDGVMITACSTHYQRLYTGKTGEDLTRPVRARIKKSARRPPSGLSELDRGSLPS
jgi:hypothetical protein